MSLAKLLATSLSAWQEASTRPGILSRAGHRNVMNFRALCAGYFNQMADLMTLEAPEQHYGTIEPHVRAAMAKSQPVLLDAYKRHAKVAYMLSYGMDVMSEASVSLPKGKLGANDKLDRVGLTGQAAVDYTLMHGGELIKGIDSYTLKIMRGIIADGIDGQLGVDGVVRKIRAEFRDMAGYRARSIATTEMNDAMSEAAINKIRDVGLDGKRWIVSPGACPICQANMEQGIIPVEQTFSSGQMRPPGHPGKCRCALAGARLPK